jgi:hypothetical protein
MKHVSKSILLSLAVASVITLTACQTTDIGNANGVSCDDARLKKVEDQRDRAVRALLDSAASLAGDLRDIIRQMLAIENEPSIPNAANLLKPRERIFQEKAAYYRDTLARLVVDYNDIDLKQQADILKQMLRQREPGRVMLVDTVVNDIIDYRIIGDLPVNKLDVDLRRERCRSPWLPSLPVACRRDLERP